MPHELDLLSSTPNATFDFDDIPSDFAPSPSPSDSSTSSANTLDAKLELLAAAIPQREGVMGSINSTNHNGSDEHAPRSTSLCLDLSQAVGPAGDDGADKVHGLAYSPTFLDNLPVLHPPVSSYASPDASPPSSPTAAPAHPRTSTTKPDAPQPIRALSAAQFADMHARYLTTHAPDSALFPFLHGLEGDNDAQNAFFVGTAPGAPAEGAAATSVRVSMTARVPRFRGLVWVASDEDDVEEYERSVRAQRARTRSASASSTTAAPAHAPGHGAPAAAPHSSDEEDFLDDESLDGSLDGEDDDYSTSSVEEDDGEAFAALPAARPDLPMDIDVDVVGMDVDDEGLDGMRRAVDLAQHGEGAHMHPVQGRGARRAAARPALSAIDTAGVGKEQPPHHAHAHRLSNASTTSTASTASSLAPSPLLDSPAAAGDPLTPPTPPSALPSPDEKQQQEQLHQEQEQQQQPQEQQQQQDADMHDGAEAKVERVTLTSTFKPRELLCIDRETGETRFVEPRVPDGISLRNFGIQVPIFATLSDIVVYSPRGNTKAALAVATHFAHAIEAKRAHRIARGQTDLLCYNVFVLCASPEEVVKAMPHVVSRMVDEEFDDGAATATATPAEHRAHTKGTDALTCSETHVLVSHGMQTDSAEESQEEGVERPSPSPSSKPNILKANTISFAQREKDEMRELTQASEIVTFPLDDDEAVLKEFSATSPSTKWDPTRGQVFLGNQSDVPVLTSASPHRGAPRAHGQSAADWDTASNDPRRGLGYDVCIECDDMAPFPSQAHMRAAEEHVARLERKWMDWCLRDFTERAARGEAPAEDAAIPPRPPPAANLVIHLPFPSSVAYSGNSVVPFVQWLETLLRPAEGTITYGMLKERERGEEGPARRASGSGGKPPAQRRSTNAATIGHAASYGYGYYNHGGYHQYGGNFGNGPQFGGPSSLPPPSAFPPSFLPSPGAQSPGSSSSYTRMRSTSATHLTSPSSTPAPSTFQVPSRTRPLKILIYSADGYSESSSLALCMMMALRKLTLPEAYLELQLEKRRSFFVYPTEVAPMRRVEARLERDRAAAAAPQTRTGRPAAMSMSFAAGAVHSGFFGPAAQHQQQLQAQAQAEGTPPPPPGEAALSSSAPSGESALGGGALARRPRANTLPPPIAHLGDHQIWFNDPRFDGSFPSRVLPFLYLGNLNHAANAYMLHALGITHVVSVGECALIPPENGHGSFQARMSTAKPGSLWIEEREGRIKVLDIKGVCDDGIDSLEPQLTPICDWIDEARKEGGKVLVHCRVGVSRSATVTIAYVMKHLNIPLVDAYLIVRSRRLSVLIQPNMRLLYNLLGWEVKLAQERAQGDPERLRDELARCLNWPYLAKEVHALNEKYLKPPS